MIYYFCSMIRPFGIGHPKHKKSCTDGEERFLNGFILFKFSDNTRGRSSLLSLPSCCSFPSSTFSEGDWQHSLGLKCLRWLSLPRFWPISWNRQKEKVWSIFLLLCSWRLLHQKGDSVFPILPVDFDLGLVDLNFFHQPGMMATSWWWSTLPFVSFLIISIDFCILCEWVLKWHSSTELTMWRKRIRMKWGRKRLPGRQRNFHTLHIPWCGKECGIIKQKRDKEKKA